MSRSFPNLLIVACVAVAALAGVAFGPIGPAVLVGLLALSLVAIFLVTTERSNPRTGRVESAVRGEDRPLLTLADPWARNAMILAITLRLVLSVILNSTGLARDLAPDTWGYELYGRYIAMSWDDPSVNPGVIRGYKPHSAYQNLNALVTYVTGMRSAPIVSLFNAFVAPLSAWVVARMSGRLAGLEAQKRTFLLAAFFPSIVLWSSMNLRDCWNWLLVALVVAAAMNLRDRFSVRNLLILGLCLAALPLIRAYMLLLVGAGIALSFVVVRIRSLPVTLVALAIVLGLMLVLGERFNMHLVVDIDERLEVMNRMKWGLSGGDAGYYRGVDISTPAGALAYLPIGTAIFLFAPFPWTPTNLRQVIAVPETLVWYVFFFHAVRHIWYGRRRLILEAGPVFFTVLIMVVAYGLVEGNEGTAYRHRSQVMVLLFIFAGGDFARRVGLRGKGPEPSQTRALPPPDGERSVPV